MAAAVTPGATAATGTARAIRSVDFLNFSYDVGDETVAMSGGEFFREGDNQLFASVRDIDFGDLDRDGREEAFITLHTNTGGTGQFTWSQIYRWDGRAPELIGETAVGDRADSGVHDAVIIGGNLVDDRYAGTSGACCPDVIERRTFRLRTGGGLVLVGTPTARAYVEAAPGDTTTVRFLRGTSSATVGMGAGSLATIDARRGQRFTMSTPGVRRISTPITVRLARPGGAVVATLTAPGTRTLTWPATGTYELRGTGTELAYGPVDITIR
jgi:hypothetical protein